MKSVNKTIIKIKTSRLQPIVKFIMGEGNHIVVGMKERNTEMTKSKKTRQTKLIEENEKRKKLELNEMEKWR